MKRFILITSLFISFTINAQEKSTDTQKKFYSKVTAGTGVFIPQGKLQHFLGISPYFEVHIGAPFLLFPNFGFGFQFAVPNQQQDFLYQSIFEENQNVKATYMANIVFNFRKRFAETQTSAFEFRLGIGASGLQTDLRNPRYTGKEDEKKYEMISTLVVNPNIEYIRKFKDKSALNFALALQYSPYKIEGAIQEDIGGFAIIPKILFTF